MLGVVAALGGAGALQLRAIRAPVAQDPATRPVVDLAVPAAPPVQTPSAEEETGRTSSSAPMVRSDRMTRTPAHSRRTPPRAARLAKVGRPEGARARSADRSARARQAAGSPGQGDRIAPATRNDAHAVAGGETSSRASDPAPTAIAAPPVPGSPHTAPSPAAPSAASPAPSVLTAPVPISLDPPRHPMAWRVIVEPPGLVAEARREHITARVRLRLLVRADGTVGAVEVAASSGRADLDAAAAASARAWRFAPARRDGEPVESRVLIWVAFVLEP